jgi:3D-(3,5/4)-trihydroxycyclohexane-1,2-dione acylhydrolase (decyclizing)
VCDNGGYAVINRLQTNQGAAAFNNLLEDCAGPCDVRVDFAQYAPALGCTVEDVAVDAGVEEPRVA